MPLKTEWKQKYYDLRSRYMNAIDLAFRLGVEQGLKEAEMQNMQMQLQQAQEQAAAAAQMPPEADMPGGEALPPDQMPPEGGLEADAPPEGEVGPEGEMLDEEMMGEEEGGEDELDQSIDELESYVRKGETPTLEKLAKSIHRVKDTKQKVDTQKSLNQNRKIVDGILKKWENESKKKTDSILDIINE